MFDIGFWELSLLAVMGLLILGPERLPGVARVVGGYLRKARRTWNNVRSEIESELAADEIRDSLKKPMAELEELKRTASHPVDLDGKPRPRVDSDEKKPTGKEDPDETAKDRPKDADERD